MKQHQLKQLQKLKTKHKQQEMKQQQQQQMSDSMFSWSHACVNEFQWKIDWNESDNLSYQIEDNL